MSFQLIFISLERAYLCFHWLIVLQNVPVSWENYLKKLCLLNYLGIVTLRVSITQPVDSFTFTVQPIGSELLLCGASKFDFVMEALALAIWCYLVATPEALIQVCTLYSGKTMPSSDLE